MVQNPKTYLTREYVAYVLAYILLKIELGAEDKVLDILKEFKEVREAYIIYGEYDIIAKIDASDSSRLNEIVLGLRKKCKNAIKDSVTMITAKGFSR